MKDVKYAGTMRLIIDSIYTFYSLCNYQNIHSAAFRLSLHFHQRAPRITWRKNPAPAQKPSRIKREGFLFWNRSKLAFR